ncbi:5-formyltetrahydrofolate cyclo-ligase [Ochrobactrum sp. RH1CCR137]|uniref:5-formyltetrahydrofolate cyclo-ligase n=1 Tax=Brucella intermedia TaxID=94625 RepID=UPI000DD6A4EB|nr:MULTISPECIES: 5-formyltetrahydrofolate cyclo-ligase [Brucella/Ochrobactrum group]KAB2670330.1 5-formyltetrahydrofolate cyclo-ligase [Ochrobactrum sp. LMG 5442]MBA8845561.1 5-formyltetrahydrofolate cyclo-ligase [Ochrobactrum sp. RH1CCR137]MBA8857283.1 5-formyltetrahydrofolate cyclo-ligase [Ochrobactrum sp. RH1CCR134]
MAYSRNTRQRIWERLKDVARPDARFHLKFSEFIPDFEGVEAATERLLALEGFAKANLVFVTPDNSMIELRRRLIKSGTPFIMPTYGMQRGFLLLQPGSVPPGLEKAAAWLDGMEHFGRPVSLEDLTHIGRFDVVATGASAVSIDGVRFGKGHAFFDLEWGMFTDLGLADEQSLIVAAVHDVQIVEERLNVSESDIALDFIATPSRLIEITRNRRRPRGVRWNEVSAEEIQLIPPLRELARMRGIA